MYIQSCSSWPYFFFLFFSIKHYMLLYQSAVLAVVCFKSNWYCIPHSLLRQTASQFGLYQISY